MTGGTAPERVTQAVILAGGLGTRLGDLTKEMPKPLLPVAGRPFLDWLLRWLAMAGVEEVILATGHLAERFASFIAEGASEARWRGPTGCALRVIESHEDRPLGTAGALSQLRGRLQPWFYFVNGDSYFDCDLIKLAQCSAQLPQGHAVMTTRMVPDTSRYGRVESAAEGRVTGFREKGLSGEGAINAGVTLLSAAVLDHITRLPSSIETEIYPALAKEGYLHALAQRGFFIDIGLPETYEVAQTLLPEALVRPAVFFDRDGVLNHDGGYTHRPSDLRLIEGAAEAVAKARAAGYRTIVVTNQSGIARGLYSEEEMHRFHDALNAALHRKGGWIDAFYHCPYHRDAALPPYRHPDHPDRKPNPGMILRAIAEQRIDPQRSFLIGDRDSDLCAAKAAGIGALFFQGENLDQFLTKALEDPPRAAAPTQNTASSPPPPRRPDRR